MPQDRDLVVSLFNILYVLERGKPLFTAVGVSKTWYHTDVRPKSRCERNIMTYHDSFLGIAFNLKPEKNRVLLLSPKNRPDFPMLEHLRYWATEQHQAPRGSLYWAWFIIGAP